MTFYAKRRFEKEGYGVTQPCQVQYIDYFQRFLQNPKIYPQVLSIKRVIFRGGFKFSNPYVKLINNSLNSVIYNTK